LTNITRGKLHVWYSGHKNEKELLASCYRECLKIAVDNGLKSIAFPAISCGAYRFPVDKACEIAVGTISDFLKIKNSEIKVTLVCFDHRLRKTMNKCR